MSNSSKKDIKSTDNPKHNMLWVGVLIGVVVAVVAISVVLLITRKSDDDSPYIIKNEPHNSSSSVSDTAYDIKMAQRVANAMAQYGANNNGKFPPASECRVGDTPLSDLKDEDGVRYGACGIVKNYLNGIMSSDNEFVDASGEPYDLVILKPNYLTVEEPHTFYVYPTGRCGNDKVITSRDSYAVSYKATDDADLICVEEPLNANYTFNE